MPDMWPTQLSFPRYDVRVNNRATSAALWARQGVPLSAFRGWQEHRPRKVEAAGASYVARWTTFHVRQLARSMTEMLTKHGFGFIEVLSPCPTLYQRRNKMGDGLDAMKAYRERSKTKNGAPTSEVALTKDGEIIVGKFVDRDRPDYMELMRGQMLEQLKDRYVEAGHLVCSYTQRHK